MEVQSVVKILVFPILLTLLVLGIPIWAALGVSGIFLLYLVEGPRFLVAVATTGFWSVASFSLTCIPLFIFMGAILLHSAAGSDMWAATAKLWGAFRGGLAYTTVFTCTVFAALSGSSLATAAAIGSMAVPEMIKRGYSPGYAVGVTACAGTLACIIPPSVMFILYASMTGTSVGKLFSAGLVPGIMLAILFAACVRFTIWRGMFVAPGGEPSSLRAKISSLRRLWAGVVLIIAVLGGIFTGFATPTEAAAIGAFGALAVVGVVYRQLDWKVLKESSVAAVRTTSMIFVIIATASIVGHLLTVLGIPQQLSSFIVESGMPRMGVMIAINLLLLLLGCLLEVVALLLLTLPILFPVVTALGFDPIWFGVIMTVNLEIGAITPPVGLVLYTVASIGKVPTLVVVKGAFPFLVAYLLGLGILVAFPAITLWLPGLMGIG